MAQLITIAFVKPASRHEYILSVEYGEEVCAFMARLGTIQPLFDFYVGGLGDYNSEWDYALTFLVCKGEEIVPENLRLMLAMHMGESPEAFIIKPHYKSDEEVDLAVRMYTDEKSYADLKAGSKCGRFKLDIVTHVTASE